MQALEAHSEKGNKSRHLARDLRILGHDVDKMKRPTR